MIMAFTITIINGNSDPTFVGTKQLTLADLAVISPTGITTPQTPYVEWVSDTTAQLDGSVAIPAWKRSGTQYFVLPAASKVVFEVESADEAIFYRNMIGKFANVTITVATDPITEYAVKFDKTKLTLAVGASSGNKITATTSPEGETVTWSSSDETVATVDGGTVTAIKAGTTTITGTFTKDGITASAACEVTVTAS
jgi:hypothetical protein